MLSGCFFLIGIGSICKKNLMKTFHAETPGKNTKAFLWSINNFNNSSVNTFPRISENLPENVSISFR